jgi:ankyrin repeat protein
MGTLFTLLLVTLVPFSLCGMEKEKPIRIREAMGDAYDTPQDRNADTIITKLSLNYPLSEITDLLNSRKVNINYHIKIGRGVYTILRCTLDRCNPNNEDDVKFVTFVLQKASLEQQPLKQQPSEDSDWEPYLFYAIDQAFKNNMNLTIVKLLVEKYGADVNFRFVNENGNGKSALHWAVCCFNGDTHCIEYLLEKGAHTNALTDSGYTPLAILAGRLNFIKDCNSNRLMLGPNLNLSERVVKRLLEHGADINIRQRDYADVKNSIELSNYDLLKPLMPNLGTIIKEVKNENQIIKFAAYFKKTFEEKRQANHSISISGQEIKLNKEILTIRCPKLFEFKID